MASKVLADRQRSHRELIAWRDAHLAGLLELHVARYHNELTPSFVAYFAALEHNFALLAETQRQHDLEKADDPQHRAARDQSSALTYEAIQGARAALEAVCGKDSLALFGASEAPVRDPEQILVAARNFIKVYRAPGFQMPPALLKGTHLDISELVGELEKHAERLDQALQQVKQEEGELHATQKAKDDAANTYDAAFSGLVNVLWGLCQMLGQKALGERLPTLYRKRRGSGPRATTPPAPSGSNGGDSTPEDASEDESPAAGDDEEGSSEDEERPGG